MDDIFRSYANIEPVAIASPSGGINNIVDVSHSGEDNETDENSNKRRAEKQTHQHKKIKVSEGTYEEIQRMREEGRNRRFNEKMELQRVGGRH